MRHVKQSPDVQARPAAAERTGSGPPSQAFGYQAFVDRSPRMLAQRRSIDHFCARGDSSSSAKSSASDPGAPIQRFKDAEKDAVEVTAEQIEAAELDTLLKWFGREAPDDAGWDDPALELVPNEEEKKRIDERIKHLRSEAKKQAARQQRLLELGVSEAELQLFETTTTEDRLIREAAAHMKVNGWDIVAMLTNLAGASARAREIALSVCAKGEVISSTAVIDLAVGWDTFNSRDDIVVVDLIRLIEQKAVVYEGGTYKVPTLTGTQDKAYTFYANGKSQYRIDPEWHVHSTLRDGAAKPGFKWKADKTNTGPGTRRDASTAETDAMRKAGFV